MKLYADIMGNLVSNGYTWLPDYKNIDELIWTKMETYFDEDEDVLSALWSSYNKDDEKLIGVVFITTKRTFTLEVPDNSSKNIKYVSIDNYSVDKLKFQPAESKNGLNQISIIGAFNSEVVFKTPSYDVAKHWIDTLRGINNIFFEELPASDKELELEQKPTEKPEEPQEKPKKLNDYKKNPEKSIEDQQLWQKVSDDPNLKEIESKVVVAKKTTDQNKDKTKLYGSKRNSYWWILYLLIPIVLFIGLSIAILFIK